MSSLFGRLKSNSPASPTNGSPAKKASPATPLSAIEQLLQDAGPLREDGTDKFFGMHNPSNTCYFNSVVQCLYFSEPFRENVMNFPSQVSLDKAKALSAASPRPPVVEGLTPAEVGGNITSETANTKALSNLWGGSKDKVPAPAAGEKVEDKNSFEYLKKQAFVSGPHITLEKSNATLYDMPESLFTSLKDMFEAILAHDARTGIVTPSKGLEVLKRNYDIFRAPIHQDAHEFLNLLLNEVVESVEAASKKARGEAGGDLMSVKASWVHELFEGTLTSETRCLTCENISQRDEVFLDLSVDLEEHSSVTSCLRKFSEEEMLCERNKFHCDKCGGLQEAEKRMKIKRLPRILALHLKRFKYIEELERMQKLFHRVTYPFFLRLPNTTDDAEDPDRLYELYAVIVHLGGTPFHGHYVAVVKTQRDGWILLDDELVMPVDKNYVRQFFSGEAKNPACAYVLFYQETTADAFAAGNDDLSDDLVSVGRSSADALTNGGMSPKFSPVSPTTSRADELDPFLSLDHAVTAPQHHGPSLLPQQTAPGPLPPINVGDGSSSDVSEKPPHDATSDSLTPGKSFKLSGGSFKLRHPSLNLRQRPKFWGGSKEKAGGDAAGTGGSEHAVIDENPPSDTVSRTQQIISPTGDTARESKLKNRFSLGRKKSGNLL